MKTEQESSMMENYMTIVKSFSTSALEILNRGSMEKAVKNLETAELYAKKSGINLETLEEYQLVKELVEGFR